MERIIEICCGSYEDASSAKHEKKLKYRISALWFMVRQSAI